MTIERAREILGETYSKYSDVEILQFINDAKFLAEIAIAKIRKMTPEEINKIKI